MTEDMTDKAALDMARTGYSFNTITLSSADTDELDDFLRRKIDPNIDAYLNTAVVLDVSKINYLTDLNYAALKDCCRAHGLFLLGLSGAQTDERARTLNEKGIAVVNSNKFARIREENVKPRVITQTFEVRVPVKVPEPYEVKVPYEVNRGEPMLVVTRNLRSGETVSAQNNSVAVFGSVANGASVRASHNVLIFGELRGQVYAGAPKDQQDPGFPGAFVYTQGRFDPTLIAIAGIYQTADDMDRDPLTGPLRGQDQTLMVFLNGNSLRFSLARDFQKNYSRY